SHRSLASTGTLAVVIAVMSLATARLTGQGATDAEKAARAAEKKAAAAAKKAGAAKPRAQMKTPWGDPDLQGIYTFSTSTPMEVPAKLAGKQSFTEAELAELEDQDANDRVDKDNPVAPGVTVDSQPYNRFWSVNERGRRTGRTSLIVDPPDGRKPPLTPRA